MRTRRLNPGLRFRRVVSGLLLGGYLVTALGVPLPACASRGCRQDHPCRTRACGCAALEQALGDCCCTTPEEKRAWLDERGVAAPPELAERKSCCSSGEDEAAGGSCCKPRPQDKRTPGGYLLGFNVHRCRGQGPAWFDGEIAPPPPPDLRWCPETVFDGWLMPVDRSTSPSSAPPAVPPPRVS
jgi:hypothetical protein